MGTTRTVGGTLTAALGLLALAVFAVAPAPAAGLRYAPAAAVEPSIGPERPIAYPVPGTPKQAGRPEVASAGPVHLVVWDGVGAVRVDRDGTVIDPSPIRLPSGIDPIVGSDGQNFLVVWNTNGQSDAALEAVRVSAGGVVLDPSPIVVSGPQGGAPRISFDGTNFLIVWTTEDGIAGARVGPDGTVVDPARLLVPSPVSGGVEVAFNGTDHLVTWLRPDPVQPPPGPRPVPPITDVYGTLLAPDGTPSHPDGIAIAVAPGSQGRATATSVGASFFVAWADSRTGQPDIYGSRVDAAGSPVDPAGIPIATGPTGDAAPTVASDGRDVLVVWTAWQEDGVAAAVGARVDRSGAVLDPVPFPVSTPAFDLDVAFNGRDYFAVGFEGGPVFGARISTGGAVLDPIAITISIGANAQVGPVTAFGGRDTLVVWADDRSPGAGLYGGRVGPDGQILDGRGFRISDGPAPAGGSVAFDGTNYLVTWTEARGDDGTQAIRAARVSRDGVVLGRFDIRVGTPDEQPNTAVVAYGGGTFLVAWHEVLWWDGGVETQIRAARVTPDGTVVDTGGFLVTDRTVFGYDLVFGGAEFLMVWSQYGSPPDLDVHGMRIATTGTLPAPEGFPIATGDTIEVGPALAWNGSHHLVVWVSAPDPDGFHLAEIRGARVDGSGTRVDPADLPISPGPGSKRDPHVAADGPFLVAWSDDRRGRFTTTIFATRVDGDGTVAHPDGFEVAREIGGIQLDDAVGAGNFALFYDRAVPEQPYGTTRAFVRTVSPK